MPAVSVVTLTSIASLICVPSGNATHTLPLLFKVTTAPAITLCAVALVTLIVYVTLPSGLLSVTLPVFSAVTPSVTTLDVCTPLEFVLPLERAVVSPSL